MAYPALGCFCRRFVRGCGSTGPLWSVLTRAWRVARLPAIGGHELSLGAEPPTRAGLTSTRHRLRWPYGPVFDVAEAARNLSYLLHLVEARSSSSVEEPPSRNSSRIVGPSRRGSPGCCGARS